MMSVLTQFDLGRMYKHSANSKVDEAAFYFERNTGVGVVVHTCNLSRVRGSESGRLEL